MVLDDVTIQSRPLQFFTERGKHARYTVYILTLSSPCMGSPWRLTRRYSEMHTFHRVLTRFLAPIAANYDWLRHLLPLFDQVFPQKQWIGDLFATYDRTRARALRLVQFLQLVLILRQRCLEKHVAGDDAPMISAIVSLIDVHLNVPTAPPVAPSSPIVECAICLETLLTSPQTLPCHHGFHPKCIGPWLAQHNTCPLCRRTCHLSCSV
ncbi:hypothetical protein SDRG_09674 [Saprolegnia diclina VS20]|uniref:RING-type domain-containing protein n=1 Tax=Saprolegnia diclina (strain VS20) TaxID=1156394 RepID=T0QD77_SAPDV|nr:hypothetical protein SDRG_09674 [Saprolegnia diclina VS20]EQC32701.1 hypothetical protein SDRG_09674 [Saprolegnia diclina VS20]|eukprot:XP_008613845.1 hypothetical protein SDRG_09674 [Saprolegnia diclina VS20]